MKTVDERDTRMRLAAFERVRGLTDASGALTWAQIASGFVFEGEHLLLSSKAEGIFKPTTIQSLLSIKTVIPRGDRKTWYDDQHRAHRQIYEGEELVDYAFKGKDPNSAPNRWLREACENRIPVIYFLGVAPALYQPMIPTFISDWDPIALKVRITFGVPDRESITEPPDLIERRYAMRVVKQRLHQTSFREAVHAAYEGNCALSGLGEKRLLDAAHIIADRDEMHGQPTVKNGFLLSKIHHAAFDANLIGIDPDYRVHISGSLLEQQDGPMLEALKILHGGRLRLPPRDEDHPDRERLERRFESFRQAA